MKRPLIPVAAVASLLMPLVLSAPGQDGKAKSDPNARLRLEYIEPQEAEVYTLLFSENRQRMARDLEIAEDLEILGEVIRAALEGLYARLGTVRYVDGLQDVYVSVMPNPYRQRGVAGEITTYPAFGPAVGSGGVTVQRPEGVFLPGYGVVYQVRIDVPPPEEEHRKGPAKDADEDSAASRSWENAKRSLRGQAPLEPLGLELNWGVPTKAELVNTLLDTLAENVEHIRNSEPEERLTVAITFPRSKRPAADYYSDYGEEGGASYSQQGAEGSEYEGDYGAYGGAAGYDFDELAERGYVSPGTARDYIARAPPACISHELSGDLHMRQHNYSMAIEAFKKAVEATGSSKARRPLVRKLIQAHVAAGELEKAQKLIEEARAAESQSENDSSSPAASQAIPLPAKLILSVARSQLEEVASGKMKREELNKHATVHYFNPPPGTPGLGSAKKPASKRQQGVSISR